MKKLILVTLAFAFALAAQAENNPQLGIVGLHQPKKTARFSLTYATQNGNSYLVTKPVDGHSQALEHAAQTGKAFPKAFIKFDGVDGEIMQELTPVYLRSYSTSADAGGGVETFTVIFETQEASD